MRLVIKVTVQSFLHHHLSIPRGGCGRTVEYGYIPLEENECILVHRGWDKLPLWPLREICMLHFKVC